MVFFCGFVSYLPFPNFSLRASSPWVFWTCFFIPANEGTMWEQLSTGQWWGRFKRSSSWSFGWDGCLKAFLHYPLKPSGILILSSPTTTCDAFSTVSTISPPKNNHGVQISEDRSYLHYILPFSFTIWWVTSSIGLAKNNFSSWNALIMNILTYNRSGVEHWDWN